MPTVIVFGGDRLLKRPLLLTSASCSVAVVASAGCLFRGSNRRVALVGSPAFGVLKYFIPLAMPFGFVPSAVNGPENV